ncbi:MAG: uroporphyrinogen decarboxylase family protein [Planctomycetota bacterium]|jgi:uroporphyrinogen decarboxylase
MSNPILWEPAIYEHKAALIDCSPLEVSQSADLLAKAVVREHELYQADYLTVGVDVYNIEAEALGAALTVPGENECPDLDGTLYDLKDLPEALAPEEVIARGRFPMLIEAGKRAVDSLGDKASVRIAASGPVTLAARLVGLEGIIMSLFSEDGAATELLSRTSAIALAWAKQLRAEGMDLVLFDSMVAPPMFSPEMVEEHILPHYQRLFGFLGESGQEERELVIGGDCTPIAEQLKASGANMLLCDFAADAAAFCEAFGDDSRFKVRRNLRPQDLLGDGAAFDKAIADLQRDLALFTHPIAGTGIIPFDFQIETLQRTRATLIKDAL